MKSLNAALIVFVLACGYGVEAGNLTSQFGQFVYEFTIYVPVQIFLTCEFVLKHFTLPVLTYFVNVTVTFFDLDQNVMPDFISGFELGIQIFIQIAEIDIAGSSILANCCREFAELLNNGTNFLDD